MCCNTFQNYDVLKFRTVALNLFNYLAIKKVVERLSLYKDKNIYCLEERCVSNVTPSSPVKMY